MTDHQNQRVAIIRQLIRDISDIDQNEFTSQDVLVELGRHGERKYTRASDVEPLLEGFAQRGAIHRLPTGLWKTGPQQRDESWMTVDQM